MCQKHEKDRSLSDSTAEKSLFQGFPNCGREKNYGSQPKRDPMQYLSNISVIKTN